VPLLNNLSFASSAHESTPFPHTRTQVNDPNSANNPTHERLHGWAALPAPPQARSHDPACAAAHLDPGWVLDVEALARACAPVVAAPDAGRSASVARHAGRAKATTTATATRGGARRGAGKTTSARSDNSAKRMTRRGKDWSPVDALALHDTYKSPQIPNVRRWSRRCFERAGSTVDRVVPGPSRGMHPMAARWHNATTGVWTVAELRTERKKGTSHLRVVLASEDRFDDASCADLAWGFVVARLGVAPLHDADAQETMRSEIVEGTFGCLWRMPRGHASDASSSDGSSSSSSSGDASSSSSSDDNASDDASDDGDHCSDGSSSSSSCGDASSGSSDASDDDDARGSHSEMDLDDEFSLEASVGVSSSEEGDRLLHSFMRDAETVTATHAPPPVSPVSGALDDDAELDLCLGVLFQIEDGGCLSPVAWDLGNADDMFSQMDMDAFASV
jgi:hypothetical protein